MLLSQEQRELSELRERVADKQMRARDIAGVLPQAIKLSRAHGGELARSLQPAVEGSVRESINANPGIFVDALHPILGPMVRRSIAESLRRLLQSLNQTLEHTFSWRGLQWRIEAWRTGKSFAEVVMLRSLVYRVEQLFLVHRETSLPLLHVTADSAVAQDSGMVAGMLSAIQDFARDSFAVGDDVHDLEEFRIGEMQVWIAPGKQAYLAAVIRGNPPRELRTTLEETIDSVHLLYSTALAKFDGDAAEFEPVRPELEACLRAQYHDGKKAAGRPVRAWLVLSALAALLLIATFFATQSYQRWQDFLGRLRAEPGIAITDAKHHWFKRSRIEGLRDPLAAEGTAVAKQSGLDPQRIRFNWKDYLALDPVSVRRRFAERFGYAKGTKVAIEGTTAVISGNAPFEWIEPIRRNGTQVPGVTAVAERNLNVVYDPFLTLQRFKAAHPLPPTVKAVVTNGTLTLAGTAPYEWIAPVREEAARIPGITAINGDDLQVEFDPALVQERFQARFGLPDSVTATMQSGRLVLTGEAPHAWLDRVRRSALEVPGVRALDDRKVEDMDQRSFQQSKSVIESAYIYFLLNKDNFATEGFAALSRLPEEIRRCFGAAQRMNVHVTLEIRGYADAVGAEAANVDLSRRRAEAVRNFLVSCGLDGSMLQTRAIGAPPAPIPGEKPQPEQADRRVAFRVIIQPTPP